MAAPAQDKDKRKALLAVAPKPKVAAGPVAAEKVELGALMRPDRGVPGAKLEVGAADDKAEAEADAVADAVVEGAGAEVEAAGAKDKKEDEEEKAPREVQIRGPPRLPADHTGIVDLAARRSVREAGVVRRTTAQGGQPHLDSLSATPPLPSNLAEVDVAADEEADLGDMSPNDWSVLAAGEGLQPKRSPGHPTSAAFPVEESIASRIRAPREAGAPLPAALRARLEVRLGVDLAAVRAHTGPEATALCRHIGARAFAHRHRIWLRSGADRGDTRLMAHEVAHTVQQGSARPRPGTRRPAVSQDPHRPRAPPPTPPARAPPAAPLRRLAEDETDTGILARGAERLADQLDSYGVLKVLIGRRLFTGETLNPSALDFVGAFMRFIGAEETFEQMKQSGSLEKGFAEIKAGLTTYDITWDRVQRTFERARDEFDWWSPIDSFNTIFGPFFRDVLAYGAMVLKIIAELVAEAFVIGFGPMGREVWEKIKAIGDNITLVLDDPLGFANNLIRAVSRGIAGFGERIWEHIKAGLLAWILGPFAAMGVRLPDQLDLKGIVSVILQVLGLTYEQLRPRIVRAMNPNGEIKVSVVERIIEAVNILRTEGLAGIWRKLIEWVENLQTTVINGIRDWVVRAVVQAGIRKLVAWSNPAGALIDILLTIYNLIVFFVERFQQILDFATSVFDSIGNIARGQINDAALAVENALKLTIPIIISFLVRLLGLPDVTGTVRRIVTNIRARVHAAFDKALDWIIKKVKKLISKFVNKFRRSNPSERVQFVLDGENHEMWGDDQSGRVEVKIASEEETFEVQNVQDSKTAIAGSDEGNDTAALDRLDDAKTEGDQVADKEGQVNRQPQTNRSTPDNREALRAEIQECVDQLQAASEKPECAGKPDEDADQDQEPPEGEGATNRTELPMRRVIRDTTEIEGAAGNWTNVTGDYDTAKACATDPADVYANLERDHVPEFALLAKLSRVIAPGVMRSGEISPDTEPLFPTLATNVPVPDGEKKESNPQLPVVVIRRVVNNAIGAESALFAGWDTNFTAKDEDYIPKSIEKADSPEALVQARAALIQSYGPQGVTTDMASHFDKIRSLYGGLPVGTVTDDFVSGQLDGKAKPVLDQTVQIIFGAVPPPETAPHAAGVSGDINIPYEPEMKKGELRVDQYAKLEADYPLGGYMERHHLIEKNIMQKFKDALEGEADRNLFVLLGDDTTAMVEACFAAAEAKLDQEARDALATTPALKGKRTRALSTAVSKLQRPTLDHEFNLKQSAEARGIAVLVLNSVNRRAGPGVQTDLTSGLSSVLGGFGDTWRPRVETVLQEAIDPAIETIASGERFSDRAFGDPLIDSLSPAGEAMNREIPDGLKELVRTLTRNAYTRFHPLQTEVIQEIQNGNEATRAWGADTIARFAGEASESQMVERNVSNWFGGA